MSPGSGNSTLTTSEINHLCLKLQTSSDLGALGALGARRGCTALAGAGHVHCEYRSRKCNVTQEHKVQRGATNTMDTNLVDKYL